MTQIEQQKAAKKFSEDWKDKGYEKGESQKFWLDLLCNVFGIQDFTNFISFEDQVKLDHTSFIDGYISSTKVLIEQKSIDKDLRAPIKQSDGSVLNPFQQAKRYITELPVSKHPRWVVTSNFRSFLVYDMEQPNGEPEEILLENLEKEFYRLSFITDLGNVHLKKELEISKKAGDIIGEIYDAILAQYKDAAAPSPATLKSLNMLCVRIVFCLYAEDAGIFGHKSIFGDYLKGFEAKDLRRALLALFQVLDQKPEERDEYLEESLAQFPYVNGGLFTEEDKTIPPLTEDIKELLVRHASSEFDWSEISPTIFGAIFESTLNPETRRSGGMHYTSIENIHKVIDPLFLDDLREEFDKIKQIKQETTRIEKCKIFHKKLGTLKFLDPACGSGNFLTETYLSLRKLGNECIKVELNIGEGELNLGYKADDLIQVSIQQFYGIEINDFAAVVAKTALWIAESQMLKETSKIIDQDLQFLPLHTYANIVEGNALRIDWETVGESLPLASTSLAATPSSGDTPQRPAKYDYIMGNPPFVGHQWRTKSQQEDMDLVYANYSEYGKLDYVCSWYKKAADFIQATNIKCAFVSTNSICQGESVAVMWKPLFEKSNIQIDFAYRTFRWDSEANIKAHVHCVIIGFSSVVEPVETTKRIYTSDKTFIEAKNINGYLLDAPNIFIENRGKPLTKDLPKMSKGSQPTDGGNLILSIQEKEDIISKYPQVDSFIKQYISADDFINNKLRYCLWLQGVAPNLYRKVHPIIERLEKVAEMRRSSPTKSVQKDAETPMLFTQIRQPETDYLVVPEVSSERRRYIPIGYLTPNVIASNKLYLIPNGSLYVFGLLISNVHMAWMRVVAGRLKSDYSYSPAVYNNFPWPTSVEDGGFESLNHRAKIEQTAQAILDARAKYPDCSLADLYDETVMPPELRKAHQENDKAVMAAYGFSTKMTESECVAELFKLYEKLAEGNDGK